MRFQPALPAPPALRDVLVAALPRLPSYADRQAAYERFKKAAGANRALPGQWVDFQPSIKLWLIANAEPGDLLVGYAVAGADREGFLASLLSVWSVSGGASPALTPLGPPDGVGGGWDFAVHGGMGVHHALPILLYATAETSGGMRPVDGRYRIDPTIALAPTRDGQ